MSGLLHRLAMHARGNNNQLHTVLRMPNAVTSGDERTPEMTVAQSRLAENTQSHTAAYAANAGAPNEKKQSLAAAITHTHSQQTKPEHGDALIPPPEPLVGNEQSVTSSFRFHTSIAAGLHQAEASADYVPELLLQAQDSAVSNSHNVAELPARTNLRENGAVSEGVMPSPLLPRKNARQTSSTLQATAVRQHALNGHAWQDRQKNTTEVHVSIGRIEVTAVHEAPTPKRQPSATPRAMTLESYLARKRREA